MLDCPGCLTVPGGREGGSMAPSPPACSQPQLPLQKSQQQEQATQLLINLFIKFHHPWHCPVRHLLHGLVPGSQFLSKFGFLLTPSVMRKKLIMPQAPVSLPNHLLWTAGCLAGVFPSPCGAGKLINTPWLYFPLLDGCLWGIQRLHSVWRVIAVVPSVCRDVAAGVSDSLEVTGCWGRTVASAVSQHPWAPCWLVLSPGLVSASCLCSHAHQLMMTSLAAQLISSACGAACSVWEAQLCVCFAQCTDTCTFWS